MEFNKKLQQLRKEKALTQEQLAEELFVSRTAISKWESGKGYPNIESLKSISKLFSVSIDNLLSGEELLTLAAYENRSNINKVLGLFFGVLDLMALAFLFLPLYGQLEGEHIRSVNLFALNDISPITRTVYFVLLILIAVLGIIELIVLSYGSDKWLNINKTCAILLQAFTILCFIMTRQPYTAALLFIFLMIKVALLIKSSRIM